MKPQAPPERGDLLKVDWVDIYENVTGDPDAARLARRTSYGLFWAWKQDDSIECLVTTTTHDPEGESQGQNGFCIYPKACVKNLRVVKRAHPKRRKKETLSDDNPR